VQGAATQDLSEQYRVLNTGTVLTTMGVGTTAANALANVTANPIQLLPGTDEVLTFGKNIYFTGTASANCVIYITPGIGF
jgi:hypothetical protein